MGMEVVHCKTVEGVQKELWMFLLIYNLARAVMVQAPSARRSNVSRISFAGALGWMRCAATEIICPPGVVPCRRIRCEPRVDQTPAKPST